MAKRPSALSRLSTSRAGGEEAVSIRLGGIAVYARTHEDLTQGVSEFSNALEGALRTELLVTKDKAIALARRTVSYPVGSRLATAVLGRVLCLGRVGILPCLTVNGRVFRLYVHVDRFEALSEWVVIAEQMILARTALSAEDLIGIAAEHSGRLNWFSASQVLWHLAYRGTAVWAGDAMFVSSKRLLPRALGAAFS